MIIKMVLSYVLLLNTVFLVNEMCASSLGYKMVEKEQTEESATYRIHVQYPKLMGRDLGVEKFNHEVGLVVRGAINDFKKNGFKGQNQSQGINTLDLDTTVKHSGNDIISVLFNVYIYMAGAAHPNSYTFVMNYSLGRAKILELPYLFKPESNYLGFISNYCRKNLSGREGILEPELELGTAPRLENFQNWNFVSEGLLFTFDPYKVASHAAGPQEVVIPYFELVAILKPHYSLNYSPPIHTDPRRIGAI